LIALLLLAGLPLTLDAKHAPGKPLKDIGEAKIPWSTMQRVRKAADPEGEWSKLNATLGPTFEFGGATWRIFYVTEEYPMSTTETARLVRGDEGVDLGSWVSSEAGSSNDVITIGADGRIEVKNVSEPQLHDLGEGDTLVVKSTRSGALLPTPKLEPTKYESAVGRFNDKKSGELLTVLTNAVWYQGKIDKPPQKLEGKLPTVWFKTKPKEKYVITPGEGNRTLSCKNPDGSVQTFVREW
jgi:hypothetical protein